MRINLFLLLLLFQSFCATAQISSKPNIYDLPIPKNIEKCFKILNKTLDDDQIEQIKTLSEDSLYCHFQGMDFFHAWKIYEGSKLTEYFNKKGLHGSFEIDETILVSYHRHLNYENIRLKEQISKHRSQQQADYEYYIAKTQTDSINGVYIPRDIEDCFSQLNKVLSEEDKNTIKNLKDRGETIQFHLSLGMWMRNNWGLWSGSRLQKYLWGKGMQHPDDMSAIILEFYYDWFHGNNEAWNKWVERFN